MYSHSHDLANAAYLLGLNTSGALKRLIGVNASNLVSIDPDALGALFGASVTVTGTVTAAGFATGTGVPTANLLIASAHNQNGDAAWSLTNTNAGNATSSTFSVGNGTGGVSIQVMGTGSAFGGIYLANSAFFFTGSATTGGLNIGTLGARILRFFTNTVIRAQFDTTGNFLLNSVAAGTSAVGVLGFGNGTAPTTSPADMVQIFSVDASAGNATLGLRTEAAVVSESVVSDRTLQVVINGTVLKFCLKA